MVKRKIEIEHILKTIALLEKYKSAKTDGEKYGLIQQLQDNDNQSGVLLVDNLITPDELIMRINKAIPLDEFRPSNMSIIDFALRKDLFDGKYILESVYGPFETFDLELSKMAKSYINAINEAEKEKDEKKREEKGQIAEQIARQIRAKFPKAIQNIYLLKQQFAYDWIQRLKEHRNLVNAARNPTDKIEIDAYTKLFKALTHDERSNEYRDLVDTVDNSTDKIEIDAYTKLFKALTDDVCTEYKCKIDVTILTDWKDLDDPELIDCTDCAITDPPNEDYDNSHIYINITRIKNKYPEPTNFFYNMICIFVHEIHHALDYTYQPKSGALGSQVAMINNIIYAPPEINKEAYWDSATEISSLAIENYLQNHLRKIRF